MYKNGPRRGRGRQNALGIWKAIILLEILEERHQTAIDLHKLITVCAPTQMFNGSGFNIEFN